MNTAFLDAVLPSVGTYCITRVKQKKVVDQRFCASRAEIAEIAPSLNTSDWNVYVAMATFSSECREAANALSLKSFFVDLDSKNGKPYVDAADASRALKAFVKTAKLPVPTVVASGGGVHAYWAFTEDVPVARWLPYARALKQFCFEHGLKIDAQVSADVARVMRLPGTLNYNTPSPTLAQVVRLGEPTPFEELCRLLPQPEIDLTSAMAFGKDYTTKDLAQRSDLKTSDFATILSKSTRGTGCAQIKWAY